MSSLTMQMAGLGVRVFAGRLRTVIPCEYASYTQGVPRAPTAVTEPGPVLEEIEPRMGIAACTCTSIPFCAIRSESLMAASGGCPTSSPGASGTVLRSTTSTTDTSESTAR
jgi:hypothetical protein